MQEEVRLEDLSRYLEEIPVSAFFECARTRPPGLAKDPKFLDLQKAMRALVPVPGEDWVHDIEVLIEPGDIRHQGQRVHAHPEWTVVFYVQPAGVPIWVETDGLAAAVIPDPGDAVVLPPGIEHWVGPHDGDEPRLSFAMLVEAPGQTSRHRK